MAFWLFTHQYHHRTEKVITNLHGISFQSGSSMMTVVQCGKSKERVCSFLVFGIHALIDLLVDVGLRIKDADCDGRTETPKSAGRANWHCDGRIGVNEMGSLGSLSSRDRYAGTVTGGPWSVVQRGATLRKGEISFHGAAGDSHIYSMWCLS